MKPSAAVLIATTLVAVAACDRGAGDGSPEGAADEAAALNDGAAMAGNGPNIAGGLWEVSQSSPNLPTLAVRICRGDDSEGLIAPMGGEIDRDRCSESSASRRPDGSWVLRYVCDMGTGGQWSVDGEMTGDFQTSYRMVMRTTTTGAEVPQMNRSDEITMDARHAGPCPEGMAEGDVEMPSFTINGLGMK